MPFFKTQKHASQQVYADKKCISLAYLIFQFEVTGWPLFRNQEQIIEEEQIPLLRLKTLQKSGYPNSGINQELNPIKILINFQPRLTKRTQPG